MRIPLLILIGTTGVLLSGCEEFLDDLELPAEVRSHPCFGNRTDTIFLDSESSFYVGCGSTTEGTGLFRTFDGGLTWDDVAGFEAFRVNHVHRADDGVLYVAGTGPNGQRVVSLGDDDRIGPVFEAASQTWNSFQVGTFLRLDDGSAIAESYTGGDLAYRPSETADWEDGYGWWTGDESYQILDALQQNGRVVAVGSTIIQPPTVFVQTDGPGFHMDPIQLAPFDGELWSIDSDGDGFIAGGVDQTADVGVIYFNDGDPAQASEWQSFDLRDFFEGEYEASWVRGVCRLGDHLVAVGELSQLGEGIVVESNDGGLSWSDTTPDDAPPLSRCRFGFGRLAITGAQGYLALR